MVITSTPAEKKALAISSVIPFLNMLLDPEKVNDYLFLENIMKFTNYFRPIVISGFFLILANSYKIICDKFNDTGIKSFVSFVAYPNIIP